MTGVEYDSILVIIERLTCYRIFILYIEASIAKDLAYAVNRYVNTTYKMPNEYIIDRDKLFISKF